MCDLHIFIGLDGPFFPTQCAHTHTSHILWQGFGAGIFEDDQRRNLLARFRSEQHTRIIAHSHCCVEVHARNSYSYSRTSIWYILRLYYSYIPIYKYIYRYIFKRPLKWRGRKRAENFSLMLLSSSFFMESNVRMKMELNIALFGTDDTNTGARNEKRIFT